MRTVSFPLALATTLLFFACGGHSGGDLTAEQRALDDNLSRWQRAHIATYQFNYRRICFCVPEQELVVSVANGQVTQAFRTLSGTYLTPQELAMLYTVEGLFGQVQEAINRKAYKVTVTYNAQLGYPETIDIDNNQNLADDEITYTVRNVL